MRRSGTLPREPIDALCFLCGVHVFTVRHLCLAHRAAGRRWWRGGGPTGACGGGQRSLMSLLYKNRAACPPHIERVVRASFPLCGWGGLTPPSALSHPLLIFTTPVVEGGWISRRALACPKKRPPTAAALAWLAGARSGLSGADDWQRTAGLLPFLRQGATGPARPRSARRTACRNGLPVASPSRCSHSPATGSAPRLVPRSNLCAVGAWANLWGGPPGKSRPKFVHRFLLTRVGPPQAAPPPPPTRVLCGSPCPAPDTLLRNRAGAVCCGRGGRHDAPRSAMTRRQVAAARGGEGVCKCDTPLPTRARWPTKLALLPPGFHTPFASTHWFRIRVSLARCGGGPGHPAR